MKQVYNKFSVFLIAFMLLYFSLVSHSHLKFIFNMTIQDLSTYHLMKMNKPKWWRRRNRQKKKTERRTISESLIAINVPDVKQVEKKNKKEKKTTTQTHQNIIFFIFKWSIRISFSHNS